MNDITQQAENSHMVITQQAEIFLRYIYLKSLE